MEVKQFRLIDAKKGAFRKKADLILSHNHDILVVQECEHPDKYVYNPTNKRPDSSYWYGASRHKGICIHSFNDYKFELLPNFNPKFRYILPFRVTGHGQTFPYTPAAHYARAGHGVTAFWLKKKEPAGCYVRYMC